MSHYPKIGIRPAVDGSRGGIRESLEGTTMNLEKRVAISIVRTSVIPMAPR